MIILLLLLKYIHTLIYSFFNITDQHSQLCNDSFEEHVLPYPLEETGLHLHCLNCSTKEFITLPPATIDTFASTWGFIQMPSIVLDTIPEIKTFTDKVGDTGIWNAEAIEGFIVHTHLVDYPFGESARDATP